VVERNLDRFTFITGVIWIVAIIALLFLMK
jgi:hypothetical protein